MHISIDNKKQNMCITELILNIHKTHLMHLLLSLTNYQENAAMPVQANSNLIKPECCKNTVEMRYPFKI